MAELLYVWPEGARFGRRIPKDQIYAHASVPAPVKAAFVEHVDQITWAFKLAPGTVNVRGTTAVPEIQVIQIRAKSEDVPDQVLAAVDRAVPLPVVFEVARGQGADERIRMQATYRPVGARVSSPYVRTDWSPADAPRTPLPAASDLTQLYGALLSPLLGVRVDPGDAPEQIAERLERQATLAKEHARLSRRYRAEKQFNRRVQVRAELKTIEKELETLT